MNPDGLRRTSFKILSEGWNTYEGEDGTIYRGRAVLIRTRTSKEGAIRENDEIFCDHLTVFTFYPRPQHFGPATSSYDLSSAAKEPVQVVRSDEVWNTYELPEASFRIKIKYVLKDLHKAAGIFDENGEQVFIMDGDVIVAVDE